MGEIMKVKLKIVTEFGKEYFNEIYKEDGGMPKYQTSGSAAVDVRACIKEKIVLHPGETQKVKSGFALDIGDSNVVALIAPRSGLGTKGVILSNTIGVCDSDYQGEYMLTLWNRSINIIEISPGERVCQMMFVPVVKANFELVEDFGHVTERGTGGFGSTGK